jgi:hypothetical protein
LIEQDWSPQPYLPQLRQYSFSRIRFFNNLCIHLHDGQSDYTKRSFKIINHL